MIMDHYFSKYNQVKSGLLLQRMQMKEEKTIRRLQHQTGYDVQMDLML